MEQIGCRIVFGYVLVLCLIAFCMMGVDKHRA